MESKDILKEFETEFEKIKKELGFKSNLKELDRIFYLNDLILKEGFVSTKLSRTICTRIANTFMSWNNYLHGLIMPNPSYMVNMTEHQMFDDNDRKDIVKLMNKILALVSTNTLVGLTEDKKAEAKFIDDSVTFWKSSFLLDIIKIMEKINKEWIDKAKNIHTSEE